MSLEWMGIAAGLMLALGIFAVKVALGLHYFYAVCAVPRRRVFFLFLTGILYGLLFAFSFMLISRVDVFRFAGDALVFFRWGSVLHLFLSAGMFVWGVRLLSQPEHVAPGRGLARGWLLLAIPCPVCASAIFLISALLLMLYPAWEAGIVVVIPLFFAAVVGVAWGGLALWRRRGQVSPLRLTGGMMILIALYFTLILLIAPHFQEAEKLYALLRSLPSPELPGGWLAASALGGSLAAAGVAGCVWKA